MKPSKATSIYTRYILFGVEDGLVSTVGFLSGIVAGGVSQPTLILTGLVLITVEAFSMAVGSFLSEDTIEESQNDPKATYQSSVAGVYMFVSYFLAGLIPLIPYTISYTPQTLMFSVTLTLVALFVLGYISARAFGIPVLRRSLRTLILGGLAVFIGIIIGRIVPQ